MSRIATIFSESAASAVGPLLASPLATSAFRVAAEDIPAAVARAARAGFDVIVSVGEQDVTAVRQAGIGSAIPVVIEVGTSAIDIERLQDRIAAVLDISLDAPTYAAPAPASPPLSQSAPVFPSPPRAASPPASPRATSPVGRRTASSPIASPSRAIEAAAADGSAQSGPRKVSVVMRDGTASIIDVPDDINVGANPLLIKRALRNRGVDCVSVALVDNSPVRPRTPQTGDEDFGHVKTFRPSKRTFVENNRSQI